MEYRCRRNREVVNLGAGEPDGGDIADVAAHVFGMVQKVEEASGELELVVFLEIHRLSERGIKVIRGVHARGVTAGGGQGSLGSRDVARGGIVNQESDGVAGAVL